MPYKLDDLIAAAGAAYPDGFVAEQYKCGPPGVRLLERLVQYLIAEICDLYDPRSSDPENLLRVITSLETSLANLKAVKESLKRCYDAL